MRQAIVIAFFLLASSCGDPETLKRLDEQRACMDSSIAQYERDKKRSIEQRKALRAEKLPTVEIAISQRRLTEGFCKRQADCFGLESEALSNFFDSCVEDEEN